MVLAKRLLILPLALLLTGCVLDGGIPISSRSTDALDLVDEDAQIVAFADASSMMETLESFIEMDDSGEAEEAWTEVQGMLDRLALDPSRDLEFGVFWMTPDEDAGAVVVGDFDRERMKEAMGELMPDLRTTEGNGLTVWEASSETGSMAMGLSDDGSRLLIGRDRAALEAASTARGNAGLEALAGPAMRMDSWIVARDLPEIDTESLGQPEIAFLVRAVQHAAGGGSVTTEEAAGVLVLHPREGVEASDLAALVRGAVAAARLQELPEEVLTQLNDLEVEDDAGMVIITGAVSRDMLERLIRS